jgi:hypothetical protein
MPTYRFTNYIKESSSFYYPSLPNNTPITICAKQQHVLPVLSKSPASLFEEKNTSSTVITRHRLFVQVEVYLALLLEAVLIL